MYELLSSVYTMTKSVVLFILHVVSFLYFPRHKVSTLNPTSPDELNTISPQLIEIQVSNLKKLPDHVGFFIEEDEWSRDQNMMTKLAEIVCWCSAANIPYVTLYDMSGKLRGDVNTLAKHIKKQKEAFFAENFPYISESFRVITIHKGFGLPPMQGFKEVENATRMEIKTSPSNSESRPQTKSQTVPETDSVDQGNIKPKSNKPNPSEGRVIPTVVNVLSYEDSRGAIIQTIKIILNQIKEHKLELSQLNEDLFHYYLGLTMSSTSLDAYIPPSPPQKNSADQLNSKTEAQTQPTKENLEKFSLQPDPDVLLLCDDSQVLAGFIPWNCRVTHFFHIGKLKTVTFAKLFSVLDRFANTTQRYGR